MLYVAPTHGTGKSTDRPSPAAERRQHRRGRAGDEELRPVPARDRGAPVLGGAAPQRGAGHRAGGRPRPRPPARAPSLRHPGRRGDPRGPARGARPGRLDLRDDLACGGGPAAARSAGARRGGRPAQRARRGRDRVRAGAARALRRGARALPGGLLDPDLAGVRLDEPRPVGGGARVRDRPAASSRAQGAARRGRARAARHAGGAVGPAQGAPRRRGLPEPAEPGAHPRGPSPPARAEPTQREVELVLAAVRALERKLRERER